MKVGFIGLGTMGSGMAMNVCKAGHDLVVHDLRREVCEPHIQKGCKWAGSAREVAQQADLVFTSLPGPREVEHVAANGLLEGLRPGAAWFDLSTNSPTVIRRLHDQCAKLGVEMLDAPVSGGYTAANDGTLALWIGGSKDVFSRHKPIIEAIGNKAAYVGAIGTGTIAKLVHNCAGYVIQTALAEVFTLGVKAGMDPLELWAAVRQGAFGRAKTFDKLSEHFLPGKFDPPAFALNLALKDVSLATELARELDVPMRLASLVREEMLEAVNRGWGQRDSRVAMLLQEERAKVDIAVDPARIAKVFREDG